jgi:aminodeoxychorismate lyase
MNNIILINGKRQSKLSVFNRLVQFGDGLFETCLVINGRLILAQQHFQRLEKGTKLLKINTVKRSTWLQDIAQAVAMAKSNNVVVKIILSRGETKRGYGFADNIEPTRIVIITAMPNLPADFALSFCESGYANNQLLAKIKHCNRLEQILARVNLTAQECIMLDAQKRVISVSQGNIFAIKNGVLITPNLDECGIEGTRRRVIIELAKKQGIVVKIGHLSALELLNCDEVFITNSVMGIKPVCKINEQIYTKHTLTEQLSKTFEQYLLNTNNSIVLKPKKNFVKNIALLAVGLLLVLSVWSFWANTINTKKTVIYQIPYGASIGTTATDLKNNGLINSSLFVRLLAKLSGSDFVFKSGYYDVHTDMSVLQLLKDFSTGNVITQDVSLIEGQTLREYYRLLSNNKAIVSQYSLVETLKKTIANSPYEGQFWPETYKINYGDSLVSVLNRAYIILQKKLASAWKNRAKNHLLVSPNQALILASLIERETSHNAEKTKIAGVFINRLKKNMRLQTDPSVVYALGEAYTGKLSKQDLWFKSPYNTYRNKGLPPSPIGSVGQSSLDASMHPLKSDYLYFVAKKDGTHVFAKTYKQHRNNIKKHLK